MSFWDYLSYVKPYELFMIAAVILAFAFNDQLVRFEDAIWSKFKTALRRRLRKSKRLMAWVNGGAK